MAIDLEGAFLRPQLPDDLQSRIPAPGLDRKQPAAGGKTAGQRREHLLHLEVRPHACTPGLRGEHQIAGQALPQGEWFRLS